MEKDFEEFVALRCSKALDECNDYIEKEQNEKASDEELRIMAENLCYKKGWSDAMAMLKHSHVL